MTGTVQGLVGGGEAIRKLVDPGLARMMSELDVLAAKLVGEVKVEIGKLFKGPVLVFMAEEGDEVLVTAERSEINLSFFESSKIVEEIEIIGAVSTIKNMGDAAEVGLWVDKVDGLMRALRSLGVRSYDWAESRAQG